MRSANTSSTCSRACSIPKANTPSPRPTSTSTSPHRLTSHRVPRRISFKAPTLFPARSRPTPSLSSSNSNSNSSSTAAASATAAAAAAARARPAAAAPSRHRATAPANERLGCRHTPRGRCASRRWSRSAGTDGRTPKLPRRQGLSPGRGH
ncbi:hypothetical protein VDBG_05177 [Verticillium alfalfae VaMs.102]|uniref:Uncharacterized protein n=1 Tax=Verticillium alfalfae (strain VaMs.102 / ATCC MYA-4576 / FGSC 10136) TaxID=526221 RepID=C9SK50_VERA1|nr:hypothetical protein VDBG_05177 [Verticillium alfalfae VaMs.102]EEY19068.1 hypothetical protein VDBG_05177 [Verticillium alfalfae VaMs.102]